MKKTYLTSCYDAIAWLTEKIPACLAKNAHDARMHKGQKYHVIDYAKLIFYLYSKGYVLAKNSSYQNRVKDETQKAFAGFQIVFYNSASKDPYGYPHVIRIRSRENGQRMLVMESCIDLISNKRRKCILALQRHKCDHRMYDTTEVLSYLKSMLEKAESDMQDIHYFAGLRLSPQAIGTIVKQYNVAVPTYDGLDKMKTTQTALMIFWNQLPQEFMIGVGMFLAGSPKGTARTVYNIMLAFNRTIVCRKLTKKEPLVIQEDNAWEAMRILINDVVWRYVESREMVALQNLNLSTAAGNYNDKKLAQIKKTNQLILKISTWTKKRLIVEVTKTKDPVMIALLWQAYVNKA
ncbi:MAG: hypothetical protein WCJ81_00785 [bacterium]